METTFNTTVATNFQANSNLQTVPSKFINWCHHQEEYRFGWLGAILASHGCVITPLTLFAIILSGVHIVLFITALVAMGLALVTNLAAMPTKIIIPAFFLSIIIDLGIVAACVFATLA